MIAKHLIVAGVLLAAVPARADDLVLDDAGPKADEAPKDKAEPPAPAAAPKERPWYRRFYIRLGFGRVMPQVKSDPIVLSNVDGAASLSIHDGPIAGSGSDISAANIPSGAIGFHLPGAGDHLALEIVIGTPLHVKFTGTGTVANMSLAPTALGLPTGVPALGPEFGEADAVPPIVTLLYKLMPHGRVQPYAGLGATVMFTFNAKATNPILNEVAPPTMKIDPAPGLVLQGGLDVQVYKQVYARLDVKYIAFMKAKAHIDHIQVATPDLPLFGSVEVGSANATAYVNPLIVAAELGYDF